MMRSERLLRDFEIPCCASTPRARVFPVRNPHYAKDVRNTDKKKPDEIKALREKQTWKMPFKKMDWWILVKKLSV